MAAEVAFASGDRVDGAFLDALFRDAFAFQKVESPLELFLQFVEAGGEIFINEYDLAAL